MPWFPFCVLVSQGSTDASIAIRFRKSYSMLLLAALNEEDLLLARWLLGSPVYEAGHLLAEEDLVIRDKHDSLAFAMMSQNRSGVAAARCQVLSSAIGHVPSLTVILLLILSGD